MNIIEYVDEVFSDEDIFHEISCNGTEEESNKIERLCNLEISRERLIVAWSTIISCLIEKYYKHETVTFLTPKSLNFLIDNNICLVDLGHLNLEDIWLQKIYNIDNNCWEAHLNYLKRRNAK